MKHFPDEGKPEKDEKKSRKSGKKEEEKKSPECHQSSNSNAECEIVKVPLNQDKVKLSLLYVVHGYVLGKGNDKVVECDHWYLVDNLVDFNSYPWAEIAFNITLVKSNLCLSLSIKHEKPVGSEVTYKCQGMAHVLVVRNLIGGEVCDDIMWHKQDAKRLVMLGLCEGPLVDDEQEDSLKNENVVEKEDLFEKGEEENMLESKNVFVDEQVPEESSMDDEKDEEDLLGNVNMVEEEDLFEKDDEEARVAHPSSQPDVLCSRTSTSSLLLSRFEKDKGFGEMEVFKSAVKGQLEELSVQVSNSHKTMFDRMECLTTEIKSIKDKIGGTQTYIALSKKKTGTPPGGHNEEGDFDGAAMQKPDVTPGNGSNSIELNPPYPYNPPNKEVDVSRPVVSPGRARRKINPAYPLLSPYTPTGLVAKKNPKKVSTTNELIIMNYFEEDILDRRITKRDIDDVNKFINLGNMAITMMVTVHHYCLAHEYKLLLCSTGWLSGNIIDSALVLLHKSYPSNKSTVHWSYFETHLPKVSRRRGLPPSEHLPSWDKVDVVYGVVCIEKVHRVAVSIQVKEKTIIIYDSLRPNRNNRSSKIHTEVGQIRDYLEKAYNRGTWCCRYDLKTPKQNDSSCGVFSFKFIEHMVRKIPVCQVQPDFATRYRCELAVQLFKKQFIEVNGTSGE
ncbi:hypothetical protein MKW92_006001 [Papaver armeniacum]|nr:hypothetical protein MKW92_006001 [Papaver armeniacum]